MKSVVFVPACTAASEALFGLLSRTRLVPSYTRSTIPETSPSRGSLPFGSLIDFAHGQKSAVQAPVFDVVTFILRRCPVV